MVKEVMVLHFLSWILNVFSDLLASIGILFLLGWFHPWEWSKRRKWIVVLINGFKRTWKIFWVYAKNWIQVLLLLLYQADGWYLHVQLRRPHT